MQPYLQVDECRNIDRGSLDLTKTGKKERDRERRKVEDR